MKKLNKKSSLIDKINSALNNIDADNKLQINMFEEHEIECKNKCKNLSIDKKRKMVGFDFEYVRNKCDKINDYLVKNSDSYLDGNFNVIIGGKSEYELKYKEMYVEDKIRLILNDLKAKPIKYFESYVNGVKHLKQEYKIHKNSQTLMHDDDDEIAIQASYNL